MGNLEVMLALVALKFHGILSIFKGYKGKRDYETDKN